MSHVSHHVLAGRVVYVVFSLHLTLLGVLQRLHWRKWRACWSQAWSALSVAQSWRRCLRKQVRVRFEASTTTARRIAALGVAEETSTSEQRWYAAALCTGFFLRCQW